MIFRLSVERPALPQLEALNETHRDYANVRAWKLAAWKARRRVHQIVHPSLETLVE